jgi:hypothetical protein
MKTIQQRRLEFLNETVNYYSEDTSRRALTTDKDGHNYCEYCTKDGRRCAIGRVLNIDYQTSLSIHNRSVDADVVYELVPDEIKELGRLFLSELQVLHDTDNCWDSNGLTNAGKRRVELIKLDYCS